MRKIFFTLLSVIIFVTGVWAATPSATSANTWTRARMQTAATPTPTASPLSAADLEQLKRGEHITLYHLGEKQDVILNGPYDSFYLSFNTPANWKLTDGSSITLKLGVRFQHPEGVDVSYGAKLDVMFDNKWVETIMLEANGDGEYKIDIPLKKYLEDPAYRPLNPGEHALYLFMDASQDCRDILLEKYGVQGRTKTTVTVKTESYFDLPHQLVPLETNLALLPRPIYQQNLIIPNSALLVVPDNPTQVEMQAALAVMAGFARMTGGALKLELASASQLNAATVQQANLILVGKAASFPILTSLKLPLPVSDDQFSTSYGQSDDGIIQYVASPWNEASAVLVVSGNSDAGVAKAGVAVSTGTVKGGEKPDLAVVSDIHEKAAGGLVPEDRTFSDLGYQQNMKLAGIGRNAAVYNFYMPPEYATNTDAYLELAFTNTAMLNLASSGLEVALNDMNFGSVGYSTKTTSAFVQKFLIPPYAVRPGINRLEVRVIHSVQDACIPVDLEIWTMIFNSQSRLHLPLIPGSNAVSTLLDLKYYPQPFSSSPDLSNFAFVLPDNNPVAFKMASKLAYDLGAKSTGSLALLQVVYANAIPEDVRKSKNLILVGKPSDFPLLQELASQLPASFKSGSNIADESSLRVVYRLPEKVDVGYLELLSAPWDSKLAILAVLGSTDTGLEWATKALIDTNSKITGNFVTTNGKNVFSNDTRQGIGAQSLAATAFPQQATPVVGTEIFLGQSQATFETPPLINLDPRIWTPYVMAGVSILIVVILVAILISSLQKRRPMKK